MRRRQNETDRRKYTRIGLASGLSVIAICALRCCNLYLDYRLIGLRLLMDMAFFDAVGGTVTEASV